MAYSVHTRTRTRTVVYLKRQFHEIWEFFLWIYICRASFRDPPLIFLKFLCCVVIELFNLEDLMRLMQKTYLFLMQIGMPLANASKNL